ncbi:RNA-directed DNA polymerase, eukaryota [Tanacetum coccineum]
MSIRRVFVDGDWKTDPDVVKDAFKDYFVARFKQPANGRLKLNISFTNRLSIEQAADMDRCVSLDEIRIVAYDSVRWDYLLDVLQAFGFSPNWCSLGVVSSNLRDSSNFSDWMCFNAKAFSISRCDGRLTLLKSVLSASPLYNMLIYKVPKGVLNEMEAIRSKFFIQVHLFLFLKDRWICDLNGDGEFRVKDVRIKLDDILLPSDSNVTRWVKYIPIKINVFAWRVRLDRLPTRSNLIRRGVVLESPLCPMCGLIPEDIHQIIF